MLSFIGRSHTRSVSDIEWLPTNMEVRMAALRVFVSFSCILSSLSFLSCGWLDVQINRKGDILEAKDQKFSSQFATVAADGVLHFW